MFSLSKLCKNASTHLIQCRYKSKTHWAKLKKKNGPKHKAMNHFDEFYGSVFGNKWEPIKVALLRRNKYVAVVNNYGDFEETIELLTNRGAHCLKKLIQIQEKFHMNYTPKKSENNLNVIDPVQKFSTRVQSDEISKIYSSGTVSPDTLDTGGALLKHESGKSDSRLQSDEPNMLDDLDKSRYIDPSLGMSAESLYQFVPATKLKGLDDWIPESSHYAYYSDGKDFPLTIETETEFEFPEHLKVFTYEMDSDLTDFPEPRRCTTGVYNYYPLDCGSVLSVLALCLSPGDRVLDLCAAPGGKSLVALQTLLPDILVCNDVSMSRGNRIRHIFNNYLHDFEKSNKWRERVLITKVDGRMFTDDQGFDKVLVDVPCTTDRHAVKEDENNIFRPDRLRERLKIPELQADLLLSALKLVKVGGAVVYSTCSLSPIQNDGVVHMALKRAFEMHGIVAHVRDLSTSLAGFTSTLQLGADSTLPKYGQLVTPSVEANFGPTYFSRLIRIK